MKSYIELIVEAGKFSANVGKTRTSAIKTEFDKQTAALENFLNLRKKYQELLKLSKDVSKDPTNAQEVNNNLEQLQRGATVSGGILKKVKSGAKVVVKQPQGKISNKIADWLKIADQWKEIDPDEVNDAKENFMRIHASTLDDSGTPQTDNPFDASVAPPRAPTSKGPSPTFKKLTWISWPPPPTDAQGNKLPDPYPYEQTAADFSEKIGPGERKLANVIGSDPPMGQGYSYDLTKDGYRYEVKSITKDNKSVRAAVEGMKLFGKIRRQIDDVLVQIKIFVEKYKQVHGEDRMTAQIESFLSSEEDEIIAGNISDTRMKKFSSVIQLVVRSLEKKGVKISDKDKRKVSIDGVEYETTDNVYNTILDLIGKNVKDMDPSQQNKFLASILKSDAFDDVDAFFDSIENALKPSNMFSDVVDGLFIVRQDGYFYMDIEDIDDNFEFKKISQGRPEYEFLKA